MNSFCGQWINTGYWVLIVLPGKWGMWNIMCSHLVNTFSPLHSETEAIPKLNLSKLWPPKL